MKLCPLVFALLAVVSGPLSALDAAEPKEVFPVPTQEELSTVKTRQAKVSVEQQDGQRVLKIEFEPSDKFPDVGFTPASGVWDLSAYGGLQAEVTNTGTLPVKVVIRADNPEPINTKPWNSNGATIGVGATQMVAVQFATGKGGSAYPLNASRISAIHLFVTKPADSVQIVLRKVMAIGEPRDAAAGAVPTSENTAPSSKEASGPGLVNFSQPDAMKQVGTLDSTAELTERDGKKVLKVETGTKSPYPNVNFSPPNGSWNLDPYDQVEIDITNLSDESLSFGGRVDNPGATGKANSVGGKLALDPGESGTMEIKLDRPFAQELRAQLKGMRYTPWGIREEYGGTIDTGRVAKMNVFLNKPSKPVQFLVSDVRAAGTPDLAAQKIPEPFFPFVDRFGQYVHADWPGKIKEDADLGKEKAKELASIHDFPRPKSWDQFGGWADGPKLEATGNFRTLKQDGKWFLVDPDGRLFFSVGMAVVQPGGETIIDERKNWFQNPPWEDGFGEFTGEVKKEVKHGEYKGASPKTFSFFSANLKRKYDIGWLATWQDLMPQRLMNWGFNTIGNWSDPKILAMDKIPYTHWVFYYSKKLPWMAGTRNPIPDPFDSAFEENIRDGARRMIKDTTDDPWCIGYFVDNELSWRDDDTQGRAAMGGNASNPAKVELVKEMKEKYGDIEKLNQAWELKFASWEAMTEAKDLPASDAGTADLRGFTAKIARKYFETVSRVMKEVAPKKLYLGCRFADHSAQVVKIAGEFCDVVSFNIYRDTVAHWKPVATIDKPVLIGEFHMGATDRGVFGPGLVKASSTEERAKMFTKYLTGAARNPQLVGAHWFALCDEPTTGRALDAENYNIGFLSITDTPYQEMIDASRQAATEIYAMRAQK